MAQNDHEDNNKVGEILYQGNKVPMVLRLVYAVFLAWAILYFAIYGVEDLVAWFK